MGGGSRRDPKLGKPKLRPGVSTERETAKALNNSRSRDRARLQPGSGNYAGRKGDVEAYEPESLLAECKETVHNHLKVEFSWIRKVVAEARDRRKKPMLVLGFTEQQGPVPNVWGCLPLDLLVKLLDAAGWDMLTHDEEA